MESLVEMDVSGGVEMTDPIAKAFWTLIQQANAASATVPTCAGRCSPSASGVGNENLHSEYL